MHNYCFPNRHWIITAESHHKFMVSMTEVTLRVHNASLQSFCEGAIISKQSETVFFNVYN